jgi:hypothetical protein
MKMRLSVCLLPAAMLLGIAASAALAAEKTAGLPALENAIRLGDQTLPAEKSVELALPPLPARPGKTIVLRFRMVSYAKAEAGCNSHGKAALNGTPLGRYLAGGDERLIGRAPSFEFTTGYRGSSFPIFNGTSLVVMFAPNVDRGDRMSADGLGASFVLDIADVARGVDGNSLSFRNLRKVTTPGERVDLIVRDIAVGWLDRTRLPRPPSLAPERPPLRTSVTAGSIRLACGQGGGFSVSQAGGPELLVETAVGMSRKVPSELIASDAPPPGGRAQAHVEPLGPAGYAMTSVWPTLKVLRTVEIKEERVEWKERWTNTGKTIAGVPFRHRLFLRNDPTRFYLAGTTDMAALASSAENPTLFLESKKSVGDGFGVVAESDWLRLLFGMQSQGDVAQLYSQTLALAPGASIDFTLSVTPIADHGSYWAFINGLRRRWELNRFGVRLPIFWNFARATGGRTPEETLAKSLAHLGPVMVALGPWLRSEADHRVVTAGRYPKLPSGAAAAPGGTPDFDVDAFLAFQHRTAYQERFRTETEQVHRAVPRAVVIQRMHPAMEVVYKPLAQRWPYIADAIVDEKGSFFEDAYYSRVHMGDYVAKGWGILYFVPRASSAYLDTLLDAARESLDHSQGDGIYSDEFSWAYRTRGYSRYDYRRWDGYSADLDDDGHVQRLKSDNAFSTESAQLQIIHETLRRGKFFLGNGGAALKSVTRLPVARFVEGGNGVPEMAGAHLSAVPLVLGNFGDETTRRGIFEAVKSCLSMGCVYSPHASNLLLEGPDNFVCKLYPITIRKLGPGWIEAEERLISGVSRTFDWPGRAPAKPAAPVVLKRYRYDGQGDLLGPPDRLESKAGQKLEVRVPKGGLVIVEIAAPP